MRVVRKLLIVPAFALAIGFASACSEGTEEVREVPASSVLEEAPAGYTFQEVPFEQLSQIEDQMRSTEGVVDYAAKLLVDDEGIVQALVQVIGVDPEGAGDPDKRNAFIVGLELQAGTGSSAERIGGVEVRLVHQEAVEGAQSVFFWFSPGTNLVYLLSAADDASGRALVAELV